MKDNNTQNKRLLKALREGPINPLKAMRELGIYRLAARVSDLKDEGHKIRRTMIRVRNRFGEDTRVAEYRLVKGGAA